MVHPFSSLDALWNLQQKCQGAFKGHFENHENDGGLLSFSLFVEPKLALRSSRFSWMHLVQAVMPGHGHHDPVHLE